MTTATATDVEIDQQTRASLNDPRLPARFWDKVSVDHLTGCWVWTAAVFSDDHQYGVFKMDGRNRSAHRVAYGALVHPVPDHLQVDHLCKITRCVNPVHLEPVPGQVNNARSDSPSAVNARRTECVRGHRFTLENTHINRRGSRICRECSRANYRAWYARKNEASR